MDTAALACGISAEDLCARARKRFDENRFAGLSHLDSRDPSDTRGDRTGILTSHGRQGLKPQEERVELEEALY